MFLLCMHMCVLPALPGEIRRRYKIIWNWSYSEPGSSANPHRTLNHSHLSSPHWQSASSRQGRLVYEHTVFVEDKHWMAYNYPLLQIDLFTSQGPAFCFRYSCTQCSPPPSLFLERKVFWVFSKGRQLGSNKEYCLELLSPHSWVHNYSLCFIGRGDVCACHRTCVAVRGELTEVSLLLLCCRSWGWNWSCQAWQQAPWFAEASCQSVPHRSIFLGSQRSLHWLL